MKSNKEKFEELIEKACNVYHQKQDKKIKKLINKTKKDKKKK